MPNTATSQIACESQHTQMERYLMYSHDQIAAADKRPKDAIIICHQKNPNKCNAIAWCRVNIAEEKIIPVLLLPNNSTDFTVMNHLKTYSSSKLLMNIQ